MTYIIFSFKHFILFIYSQKYTLHTKIIFWPQKKSVPMIIKRTSTYAVRQLKWPFNYCKHTYNLYLRVKSNFHSFFFHLICFVLILFKSIFVVEKKNRYFFSFFYNFLICTFARNSWLFFFHIKSKALIVIDKQFTLN